MVWWGAPAYFSGAWALGPAWLHVDMHPWLATPGANTWGQLCSGSACGPLRSTPSGTLGVSFLFCFEKQAVPQVPTMATAGT